MEEQDLIPSSSSSSGTISEQLTVRTLLCSQIYLTASYRFDVEPQSTQVFKRFGRANAAAKKEMAKKKKKKKKKKTKKTAKGKKNAAATAASNDARSCPSTHPLTNAAAASPRRAAE